MKFVSIVLSCLLALSFVQKTFAGPTTGPTTEPSTQPALIDASDKAAIDAAMNKDAEVEGVVASAEWSTSGKVLLIKFEKADESKFVAAMFDKDREAMDKAFAGDIGKALTGAKVRVKGKVKEFKGHPEIVISMPSQVTIVEAGK